MSGTRADRPQYQALLVEARRLRSQRKSVIVIVKWLHRFGRRLTERVRCWEEFKALAVEVHGIADGGLVPEFVANILATVAQEEARQLSERVSETWKHTRSLGWYQVGRAPWGYKWRPRSDEERTRGAPKLVLEVDPIAGPYAREALKRVADGESARSVARWVATLPAHVRQGESLECDRVMGWRNVQRMLVSPTYIARDSGSREIKLSPAQVLAYQRGQWPALVDESHRKTPHQATGSYLLTGLIRCSLCSIRMQGMMSPKGPRTIVELGHGGLGPSRAHSLRRAKALTRTYWQS